MASEPWDQAARRLVETWLAALGPLGQATTVPGTEGSDPLLHFRQFADLLGQAGDANPDGPTSTASMHAAAVQMMDALAAQVASLREALAQSPAMSWMSDFSDAWPPMLGPWREVQARGARTLRAMNAATEAGRSLQHMHLEVLARALDTCRQRLSERDGPSLDSVRAFFDAWVAIVDAAYRERAFADDYAEAFAKVVNAASELRLAMLGVQSPWSGVHGDTAAAGGPARDATEQHPRQQPKSGPEAAPVREATASKATASEVTASKATASKATRAKAEPVASVAKSRRRVPAAVAPEPVAKSRSGATTPSASKSARPASKAIAPHDNSQARPSQSTRSKANKDKTSPGTTAKGQEFDITRILAGKS